MTATGAGPAVSDAAINRPAAGRRPSRSKNSPDTLIVRARSRLLPMRSDAIGPWTNAASPRKAVASDLIDT